jgi:hypothetical protein
MPNHEKHPPRKKRLTWTNQAHEEAMEVVEIGTHSL